MVTEHPRIAAEVNAWFGRRARELPWRAPEFSAWGILVSEVMLQQTQVARVIPVLERWLERWPAPAALAASPAGDAVRMWGRLGYPRRALRLHAAATAITDRHDGMVPCEVEALLELPGIGEYTARAVAAFAFGVRTPVVDTNVRRVLARAVAGRAHAGPPSVGRDLALMESVLPADPAAARITNAAVMELGATVCLPRAPLCERCPIAQRCAWRLAGYPDYDGPVRRPQPRFAGSDRQARGAVLAQVRATEIPVRRDELQWPERTQLARAVGGLIADGLIVETEEGLELPQ